MTAPAITPTRDRHAKAADIDEIRRALALLFEPGQVVELRALNVATPNYKAPHTVSGYYTDFEALAKDAAKVAPYAEGVYVTLNPVKPALLARAANRCKPAGKGDQTTSDRDITRRRWLGIDIDTTRPAGISSTDEELEYALEVANDMRTMYAGIGWPNPIMACSGNGAHLDYRIDLPADDGGLVARVLKSLALFWDDARIKVDLTVFNPARIWKLYGTIARKGDDTEDRPHRLARMINIPDNLGVVTQELLTELAQDVPEEPKPINAGRPAGGSFDLVTWIKDHAASLDLLNTEGDTWDNGRKWIFRTCPFNSDHKNRSAFILQFPSGKIAAGCRHNGCHGKGWHDLRDIVEPGWRDRKRHDATATTQPSGNGYHPAAELAADELPPIPEEPPEEPPAPDLWQPFTLADAYQARPPVEYIVSNLFALPSLNIAYGAPGTLKSFIMADLAICAAAGCNWLTPAPWIETNPAAAITTRQAPVMWLDFDNGRRRTHDRIAALARARDLPIETPIIYYSMPSPWLVANRKQSVGELSQRISNAGARLVVIDNLGVVSGDAEENSGDMVTVMSNFRQMAEETGAAIVLIHHQRKGNGMTGGRAGDTLRGHSSIEAALDLALMIEREEQSDTVNIRATKVRGADVLPFSAVFTYQNDLAGELELARFFGISAEDTKSGGAIEREIMASLYGTSMNKTDLVKAVKELLPDVGLNRIRDMIDRLAKTGRLNQAPGKNNTERIYSRP